MPVRGHVPQSRPALRWVFTPEVVARLARAGGCSELLLYRLGAITHPPESRSSPWQCSLCWRQHCWETYLQTALDSGQFEGDNGNDLLSRLRGRDDAGFRSAMAECVAAWFFEESLDLRIGRRPEGRGSRKLDLLLYGIDGERVCVEVKAPRPEPPPERGPGVRVKVGDDADALVSALDQANKQFEKETQNLLVIVPQLFLSVFECRYQFFRAFYGEEKISIPLDATKGGPAGPPTVVFSPEGRLLKTYRSDGLRLPAPRFTRVGGVLCLEEYWPLDELARGRCPPARAVFLPNPYAEFPVAVGFLRSTPHLLVDVEGPLVFVNGWSDRRSLHP